MMTEFVGRIQIWSGPRKPPVSYGRNVRCAACGQLNRRELRGNDRACWSCDTALPSRGTPRDVPARWESDDSNHPVCVWLLTAYMAVCEWPWHGDCQEKTITCPNGATMPFHIVPTERRFFVLFRENAATLMACTETLQTLLNSEAQDFVVHAGTLKELEVQADEITHRIHQQLNRTFITPFDREDIYALASAVDDVIDLVEEVADTIVLDCIEEITPQAQRMGDLLLQIAYELVHAFDQLESQKGMATHWVRIHQLENEGDTIMRQAIGTLFHTETDPLYLIKWKDVYALLEKTVDRTEEIAAILESVTIKNG